MGQSPYERRELHPLPSLILLDLDLPFLNGLEFLNWRQTQPDIQRIPVLVLTASQPLGCIIAAYKAGANSYRVKPQTFDGLVELVKAMRQ